MKEDARQAAGRREEDRVFEAVSRVPGVKIYRNLYAPAGRGRSAEIDLLLISASGLWIIEVKSRTGYVVGSRTREWSQHYKLPGARAKKIIKFYSPVKQCARQQAVISRWLGVQPKHIKGLVVFPDRTRLKVPSRAENCTVLQTHLVASHLRRCLASRDEYFSPDQLSRLERRLDAITNTPDGMKRLHVIHARQAECARRDEQMWRRETRQRRKS